MTCARLSGGPGACNDGAGLAHRGERHGNLGELSAVARPVMYSIGISAPNEFPPAKTGLRKIVLLPRTLQKLP